MLWDYVSNPFPVPFLNAPRTPLIFWSNNQWQFLSTSKLYSDTTEAIALEKISNLIKGRKIIREHSGSVYSLQRQRWLQTSAGSRGACRLWHRWFVQSTYSFREKKMAKMNTNKKGKKVMGKIRDMEKWLHWTDHLEKAVIGLNSSWTYRSARQIGFIS